MIVWCSIEAEEVRMKRIISTFAVLAMLFTYTAFSFGVEREKTSYFKKVAIKTGSEEENIKIDFPKFCNGFMTMTKDGEKPISMKLPSIEEKTKAQKLGDDGVIFRTKEVDISERVVEENSKEGKVVALESQVKIKNANANKGYRFSFFLPKGFKLVDSRTYEGMKGEKNFQGAYVVNDKGEVADTIEPMVAEDANGKKLKVDGKIEGDSLVQKIHFDKETAFPIVAKAKKHPPIKRYAGKITKKEAKKARRTAEIKIKVRRLVLEYVFFSSVLYSSILNLATSKWDDLIRKYTIAIARVTKKKKHIEVYNIKYWRNGGKNSGYITRDQELENVK